jgi:RNA polymerase sigma-70 factor, ECF subfamily
MMHTPINEFRHKTDEDLVTAAQAGDHLAFAELVSRNYSFCRKMAISILRDPDHAEDEVQNAVFKAYQHIGQFQRDARFSTWLTRIVVNQCLMRLRSARRSRFLYLDDAAPGSESASVEMPDQRDQPDAGVIRREVTEILHREMSRIPPLLRNVFLLREVEQLPMSDVAARLGISVAAAKSRLLRARHELRSRLEKYCGRMGPATLLASS